MYASLPTDSRHSHPFYMYEEIKAQPEAVQRSLTLAAEQGAAAGQAIARARRVYLTGCGTSFHAAQVGTTFLRAFSRGGIDARAVQAFDLVTFFPHLRPDDVVVAISHSGTTHMTRRAVEGARQAGAETVMVTGFPENIPAGEPVLPTGFHAEKSWAHTASYTAALATLAAVANGLAVPEERVDLSPLPALLARVLQLEEMVHRVAATGLLGERYGEPLHIVLAGAGPNVGTAREGVLKLLETSYCWANAFELEEMLHGPLAAVTPDTLLIVLAPPGQATGRAADLVRAARAIGTTPVVLAGEENAHAFPDAHRLLLPEVPEILSPLPYVIPLQLLSYFLAVGKGNNPDLLHRDQEPYRAARAQYA